MAGKNKRISEYLKRALYICKANSLYDGDVIKEQSIIEIAKMLQLEDINAPESPVKEMTRHDPSCLCELCTTPDSD